MMDDAKKAKWENMCWAIAETYVYVVIRGRRVTPSQVVALAERDMGRALKPHTRAKIAECVNLINDR
jgi:hypothetical protein